MRYRIELFKKACIGCAGCAKMCPKFWAVSKVDEKSELKGAKKVKLKGEIVKEVLEVNDLGCNLVAAKVCPLYLIHIYDNKEKKQLI